MEYDGPRKEDPAWTDGRVDALATYQLEGLHVGEGVVFRAKTALEINRSQEDLAVSRSKLENVCSSKGPRHHTPV